MFKILLCILPDYEYFCPPLGTSALTGYLKSKQIDVQQIDYNLLYRDFLVKHVVLDFILNEDGLQEKRIILKELFKIYFSRKRHADLYYSKFLPGENIDELPYDNNTNSSFYFTERLLSSKYLYRYIEDEEENTFLRFLREEDIISKIVKMDIKYIYSARHGLITGLE